MWLTMELEWFGYGNRKEISYGTLLKIAAWEYYVWKLLKKSEVDIVEEIQLWLPNSIYMHHSSRKESYKVTQFLRLS